MEEEVDMETILSEIETTVGSTVTIKNIERELICPACKELFTHPLILPCQHSVCHKCVKELLFLNHDDIGTDACSEASSPGSPRGRILSPSIERIDRIDRHLRSASKRNSLTLKYTNLPCPGCEREIDLGDRGIHGLFRNFTLEAIVERYRQAARAATAIMCDLCKPPPQESTKSCMDCNASYCNECFKLHHPWGTLKAQHEYVGPTTNFRPKVLMCPEHEMEKVNMYCEICKRPVCHLCKLGGAHANHRVSTMSSAYKTLKEKLSKGISYLISKESEVKNQISELEQIMKRTEHNGDLAEDNANNSFEKLFTVLEDRKSYVLKSIQSSKTSRLDKLQNQLEEYQGLLENNGLVGYAQEVLKETDQSCFVQTAKQLHERIQKATESLNSFRPAVHSSFEEFKLDVSTEKEILGNLSFSKAVDVPSINKELSKIYNEAMICWHQPGNTILADSYVLEYRRHDKDEEVSWEKLEVLGTSKVVSDLQLDSAYCFRVRGFKDSVSSLYSSEVTYHTAPAPVFSFLFDDKCGYNEERLLLNKRRDCVESTAGFPLLLSADRMQVGCYMCLDYLIGDTGITKGKHFWAFHVEPSSYLVRAGVTSDTKLQEWLHSPRDISSPRYDQDSGHDSGSEDACDDVSQPFSLATIGMNKFFIPKASNVSSDYEDRVLPLPSRIGVCIDYEKGLVRFYDASNMNCLYERKVDCSGIMYPAFAMMGGGRVQLEELISMKCLNYPDEM